MQEPKFLNPDAPFPWLTREIRGKASSYGAPVGSATWESLVNYIERGVPVGHFLTALLSNDLKLAFGYADETNSADMKAWVMVLVNLLPIGAQGSEENVRSWREMIQMLQKEAQR
jgi:hypothetical protein